MVTLPGEITGEVKDKQVITQVVTGDLNTFEMVFRDYYKPLVRYGNTFLKDSDEAEDIVQQVFVTLWEKRTQLDIHTSIRAVLYKSVQHACLNKIKHLKVRRVAAEELKANADQATHSDPVLELELQERIRKAMQHMPEQCGRIFSMSRFEQLRYQEIADQLGLSVKTVENQMGKALKIIREELKDYLPLLLLFLSQIV
jgi:RNA polymerase sigma-70 factor (ECF subfamily)